MPVTSHRAGAGKGLCRWIAAIVALAALASSHAARAALLTNFAGSFAQYQAQFDSAADFDRDTDIDGIDFLAWQRGMGLNNQSNNSRGDANGDLFVNGLDFGLWKTQLATVPVGIPQSVLFKLYFDPAGIVEGQVSVVVEAPQTPNNKFAVGSGNGIISADPRYDFSVVNESVSFVAGFERYEAIVHFTLKPTAILPTDAVTLFGYQVQDLRPLQSLAAVENGFEFNGPDFITIRNEDLTTTTFTSAQLDDVPLVLQAPMVLDVSTSSGAVRIRNPTGAAVDMTYYEITSVGGSLVPANWNSIDDGEGDPPGFGWDEAGGASAQALAESAFIGTSLAINPGQTRNFGPIFNSAGLPRDLKFRYVGATGGLVHGVVNYDPAGPIVAVPEPTGGVLTLIGLTCLATRRRATANAEGPWL